MIKLKALLKTPNFWCVALMAVFAGVLCFAPQIFASIQGNWKAAYYIAGYRLLFPLAVIIAAWRFGVRGGLITSVIVGAVIVSSVIVNSHFPNAWIDLGEIALCFILSWLVGKQGEVKQRLETTTAELRQQSALLKTESSERQQAEEQYRLIAEHTADIIYKIDIKEERFTYISPSGERILGYTPEEAMAATLKTVLTPASYEKQHERMLLDLKNGINSSTLELELIHKDGHVVPFESHASFVYGPDGKPVEIVGVARDITDRKKMEEQLIVQDRLASIGQLTSGLAHELNNPLTSILSLSSLLAERELADDAIQDLKSINDEAQRIVAIVKNMLTFARKQPQEKAPADINEAIRRVVEMRAYTQKVNNIQVNLHLDPELPRVMGNVSQLEQVFFNIIINAEYFMLQAHQKGTLNIATEKVGKTVHAIFTDDGPGIPPENMGHLFTPFFSTKEANRGTGLSLSICLGIVTEHGGTIYVNSEVGQGSTFVVQLPAIKN
ncbi:MAG: PAS domain S-box protein [Dehalococcoidales bacterium]|jgi:PAS domain S-box-containing protein